MTTATIAQLAAITGMTTTLATFLALTLHRRRRR